MSGALHLDQGEELVHLHPRLVLLLVAQQVGDDGLVVLDVGAEWDGDGLTLAVGHLHQPLRSGQHITGGECLVILNNANNTGNIL